MYIYVCVYIHVYIFFCLFSSRSFFLSYFFHYPFLLSPYPLEIFFSSHVLSLKKVHRLSLSLSLSGIFVSIHQFVSQIDRFFLLLSFLYQSQGDYFPSIFVVLDFFLVFRLDRFHAFRVVSQIPPLRLSFLLYRIQGISLSIFPVDSSQNRLDFRSLPPRLSRIPPLATLSLSFVPPLGIFTSSLFVARYFIISFTFMQFMQLHTKLISFSIVKFLNSMMFFLDRFILLPHFHS